MAVGPGSGTPAEPWGGGGEGPGGVATVTASDVADAVSRGLQKGPTDHSAASGHDRAWFDALLRRVRAAHAAAALGASS